MIYYALVKGAGEGCDYTIGCNIAYFKLKADNDEDAKKEFVGYLKNNEPEGGWASATLLECTRAIQKIFPNKEWDDE